MVELQQSQAELEDEASIMDEAEIWAQVLGKSVGTISRIGPAPRKSYSNAVTTLPKLMQQLEILTKRDKAISELTQSLEQQTLLIQVLVVRMDMSHHPPTEPTNDPPPSPPPSPSVGTAVL
ncbi:Hypothetical predicted protein [Olea europaea subsp. europaea]|uniref:Uncharacterized protein n=1 Tax=Olea europaea subsp. europaea TaxID=158383 RepID=A0A8S0V2T0_OLEEU|nr:Hypothetical predicted protein [Olea europaea subsp. europaea]